MAIITSWAVGVDTTANQPAAATAGRLYLSTTTGSNLYLPQYDDGSNWQPWRANFAYPLRAVFQTQDSWTIAGSGDTMGGANRMNYHKMDFTRFRQARITARANCAAISSGNVSLLIYDVTNSQNITGEATFTNDGNWHTISSSWGSLNSATYAGDAEFECQIGSSGSAGDIIRIGTVILELR